MNDLQNHSGKDGWKKRSLLLERYTIAPAPSRDYHGLHIFVDNLIWLKWKISHGPYFFPIQKNIDLIDFLRDPGLQNEIRYIFDQQTVSFILNVAQRKWCLNNIPPFILKKVLQYLKVRDILSLSQVSKNLFEECSKNHIWENICRMQFRMTQCDIRKGNTVGWKRFYFEKAGLKKQNISERKLYHSMSSQIISRNESRAKPVRTNNVIPITRSLANLHKTEETAQRNASLNVRPIIYNKQTNEVSKPVDQQPNSISKENSLNRRPTSVQDVRSHKKDQNTVRPSTSRKNMKSSVTVSRNEIEKQVITRTTLNLPYIKKVKSNLAVCEPNVDQKQSKTVSKANSIMSLKTVKSTGCFPTETVDKGKVSGTMKSRQVITKGSSCNTEKTKHVKEVTADKSLQNKQDTHKIKHQK